MVPRLFLVGGVALLIAGLVDLVLLLFPPRFGDVDWEFGVLSQSIDALPLASIGVLFVAAGLCGMESGRLVRRILSVLLLVAAVGLLGILVVLGLAAGTATSALNDPQAGPAVKRILFKAFVNGLTYIGAYITLAMLVWRTTRRRHAPTSASAAA